MLYTGIFLLLYCFRSNLRLVSFTAIATNVTVAESIRIMDLPLRRGRFYSKLRIILFIFCKYLKKQFKCVNLYITVKPRSNMSLCFVKVNTEPHMLSILKSFHDLF